MRIATYNIHRAKGIDGHKSLRRVADVLAAAGATVVGLQEVEQGRFVGRQPMRLSRHLGMRGEYLQTLRQRGRGFGNLLLTSERVISVERIALESDREPRGCVVAKLDADGTVVAFATTHVGLDARERGSHLALLARVLPHDMPLILVGDFNAGAEELAPLAGFLRVVDEPPLTFPAGSPKRAIDLVAYSPHWRLVSLQTLPSEASDHLPLVAELELIER